MPATVGRITKAAKTLKKERQPLLPQQRIEKSRRTTTRKAEEEKRQTAALKSALSERVEHEKGRIRRENIEAIRERTRESSRLRLGEIATRQSNSQQLIQQRKQAALDRQMEGNKIARRDRVASKLVEEPLTSNAAPITSSIIMVLFVMAGLIILYALVTYPAGFSGFLNGLTGIITNVSRNGPLFTKAAS